MARLAPIVLVWLALGGEARAFECTRSRSSSFITLRWDIRQLSWAMRAPGPTTMDYLEALELTDQAFEAWKADCTDLEFERRPVVEEGTPLEEENQVAFLPEWPHEDPHILALTTMTHQSSDGRIRFGVIEVNEQGFRYTDAAAACEPGVFDLGSVMTHEVGHFLGLAHTQDELVLGGPDDPTMTANIGPCDTRFRSLAKDDTVGVCFLYPIGGPSRGCDVLPPQDEPYISGLPFGCVVAPRGSAAWWLVTLAALGLGRWRARRGSTPRRG